MTEINLIERYNYDAFVPAQFEPWMNFDQSPKVGERAPDFPLWPLEGGETTLSTLWSQYNYLVVGSGWGLAALQAADAEQRTRGSTVQPIFEIGERRPYCAPNLGLGWSHARLGAMNGIVLRSTQRVSHSFRLPLTRMVLTVVLLVVCAQITLYPPRHDNRRAGR